MQGAAPLASPGAEPGRHWGRGRTTRPVGAAIPVACQPCSSGIRRGGLPSLSPAHPAFSSISFPYPPDPLPGGKGEIISSFRRGLRPRHPGGGNLRFGARGEESVAYRLARAVRVQPRGCKGRSPLHEIILVSPSPMGEGAGGWGQNTLRFSPGAESGRRGFNFGYSLPVGFAGTHRFKSIQIREKFWGVWGTLSRVPQRLSSVSPAIAEVQFFRKVVPSLVSTSVTPRSER